MSDTASATRPERHLRRDAAANRELLLDAASRVFASQGLTASVEEIARVAGVGIGTLYRRFPTKEALIAELVRDMLEAVSDLATAASEALDGRGLEQFLEASSAYQASRRGCLPRLWNTPPTNASLLQVRQRIAALLSEAKRHGRVRDDLTNTDVTMVMWSIRGVIETTGDIAPGAWRRHLSLLIAGLRPSPEPLCFRPLTRSQMDNVLARSG